jgi:hypothetical protein
MKPTTAIENARAFATYAVIAVLLSVTGGVAQGELLEGMLCFDNVVESDTKPSFDIYGFAQVDYIQDFNRVEPTYRDTLRPTRIATEPGEFGSDGLATLGVRQSRFGVRGNLPTSQGMIKTVFEFDLFGVGVDAGQTTMRLRHAYGEWGNWLGGQTHSLFMDIDVFPNTIDYWGPNGMVFLRNPQIRWTPLNGDQRLAFAIEFAANDIDVGTFNREIEDLGVDVNGVTRMPDFTSQYRLTGDWGHFQVGGILRMIGYETLGDPPPADNEPRQEFAAWGINLSTNIKFFDRDRLIGSFVIGEGIASYMNDGGVDLAPTQPSPLPPGVATVPLRGYVLYYDHHWSDRWSSSFGGSMTEVNNLGGQGPDAFKRGLYSSANLLYVPTENVLCGIEYLWGRLENFGGASGEDNRIQISFKYSF